MEILETLRALNACFGPSGQEGAVAEAIRKIAAPYVDECTVDTLGNLLCHKKGKGPKVLFADAVSAAKTSILVGELAKLLKQNGVDMQRSSMRPLRKQSFR